MIFILVVQSQMDIDPLANNAGDPKRCQGGLRLELSDGTSPTQIKLGSPGINIDRLIESLGMITNINGGGIIHSTQELTGQ